MNFLFTCVGRRVELIRAFKGQSVDGKEICVFGIDSSSTAPAAYYCDHAFVVPNINDPAYIPSLLKICADCRIDLLIPTIDTDLILLSEHISLFAEIGTKVLISDPESVKICSEKRKTGELFQKAQLAYPKCADRVNQYMFGFPAFIKPLNGSSSIEAYKVESEDELLERAKHCSNPIIQPYIDGREFTIDIFCDFGGSPIYITPRERLAVRAGEVLKTRITQDPVMIEEAKRLVSVMKPCGPVTVQLIKEKTTGINWYIEINPRFGGGAPLSMKAGADSAAALVQLMLGKKLPFIPNAAENDAVFCRFDQSVRLK